MVHPHRVRFTGGVILAWCGLAAGVASLSCDSAARLDEQSHGGPTHVVLAPVRSGNKWGFVDRSGRVVISARFRSVTPFAGGLAAVETPDGWGYIDPSGTMVITPRFHAVGRFVGPYAIARAGYAIQRKGEGTYGFIDKTGRWVVPPIFDAVAPAIAAEGRSDELIVQRTAMFRDTRYTVEETGDLTRDGRPVSPDDIAADVFIKETEAHDLLVRMRAHRGLGRLGTRRAMAVLAKTPVNCGWQETTAAAQGMEQARPGAGVEYVAGVLGSREAGQRRTALFAMLMLCRDPHCKWELRKRTRLLPESYRIALVMLYGPVADEKSTPPRRPDHHDELPRLSVDNVTLAGLLGFIDEIQGGRQSPRAFAREFPTIKLNWDDLRAVGVTPETDIRADVSSARPGAALDEMFLNIRSAVPLARKGGWTITAVTPMPIPAELIAWGEREKACRDRMARQAARDTRDAKTYPMTTKRLAEKMPKIDFANTPLELVVDFLREVSGLWIYVDWESLGRMGIAKDTEVNIHLLDVTFKQLLRDVLAEAGGKKMKASYCLSGGGLIVSSEQALAGLRKRFFPRVLGRGAKDDPLTRNLHRKVPPASPAVMSLSAALEHICRKAHVPIVVQWDGIKSRGITEDKTVDVTWLTGRTVAEALELLFSETAGPGAVKLAERKGHVIVTRGELAPMEEPVWWELIR